MQEVNVGIVGLGNVGSSTLAILSENGDQIAQKLGYRLKVVAVCSRSVHSKQIPAGLGDVFRTTDWREVVSHPDVQIVAELVGGTSVAAEIVNSAIANRKSVVTANKELMAACGPEIWDRAIQAGINLAMHVLPSNLVDEVFQAIHPSDMGLQHDIAVLHLDFQVILLFKPDLQGDTFRDSNRQTITPLLRCCFHALPSCVDTL